MADAVYVRFPVTGSTVGSRSKSNPSVDTGVTVNVSVCPDSFGAPALMFEANPATICKPASSRTAGGLPVSVKVGVSFTPVTEMIKVCVALVSTPPFVVPPSSVAETVNVAVPLEFAVA